MALTTIDYSPLDRNPDYANGEMQQVHLIGDGSEQCFDGAGEVGDVINNVAVAGSVSVHDVATGESAAAANRIALFDTAALGPLAKAKRFKVENGLRLVTTAATNDVTVQIRGRQTVSLRIFGV